MTGKYVNDWSHYVSGWFHDHLYPVWHWWVNRPNSRSRRFLEDVFPGLKGKRP